MDTKHLPIIIAVVGIGIIYLYWQMNKKNQFLEEQIYYLQAHVQRLANPLTHSHEPIEIEEDDYVENGNTSREIEEVVDYGYEDDSDDDSDPEPVEQEMSTVREIVEEVTPAEDVVISKLSHCPHILMAGKNKGSSCGKPTHEDTGYCKNHSGPTPLNE